MYGKSGSLSPIFSAATKCDYMNISYPWIYSAGFLSGIHNRHFNSTDLHQANELTDLAEWYVTGRLPHGLLKYIIWKE